MNLEKRTHKGVHQLTEEIELVQATRNGFITIKALGAGNGFLMCVQGLVDTTYLWTDESELKELARAINEMLK